MMNKAFNNFPWKNFPSDDSPLDEIHLMIINNGLDEVDNRVLVLDTTKFNKSEAQMLIKNITFDLQTGILKKYYYNGATEEINTGLSKLDMNLRFDKESQILYIVNADGTEDPVDLSDFITNYEFRDSETIAHNVSADGTVTSIVKEGSIEEKHLRPNYLADIKVEVAKAEDSKNAAATSESNAKKSENAVKASENAAATSETNAATGAEKAEKNALAAEQSADDASGFAGAAESYRDDALISANKAQNMADAASTSATTATNQANAATQKATAAANSATAAATSATLAESYAEKAKESADKAQEMAGGNYLPATTKYAGSDSVGGNALNSYKVGGYSVSVVSALPSDAAGHADTFYVI